MKIRILLYMLLAALMPAVGSAGALNTATRVTGASVAQGTVSTAQSTVYELKVDGLACPYCAYGIEKTFEQTNKVQNVDVRIAQGNVVLRMKPGQTFTRKELAQQVSDAGFTLHGVKTTHGGSTAQ